MHPQISAFPSKTFYGGRLDDAPLIQYRTCRDWHADRRFPPFAFIDVGGTEDQPDGGTSWRNECEAETVARVYDNLFDSFLRQQLATSVGVISPYRAQRDELQRQFTRRGHQNRVVINTVDVRADRSWITAI